MAAGDPQPLFRAQDVGTSTVLKVTTPKNWKVHANKVNFGTVANANAAKPRYLAADYTGNAFGGDVSQATCNIAVARQDGAANETLPPIPRTQAAKATALGTVLAQDVTRDRGWIAPGQPYRAKPTNPVERPTLTSITPTTAVAGAATPVFFIKLVGTNFTIYSVPTLAGLAVPSGSYKYISPTEMRVQMSPASSVAGTTTVDVIDHGETVPTPRTFTWT